MLLLIERGALLSAFEGLQPFEHRLSSAEERRGRTSRVERGERWGSSEDSGQDCCRLVSLLTEM